MISGVINVYKEKGFTSHDVVAKMRGILRQKKIGHTGTLDPEAEGVLPICLGAGTKLCDMLTDTGKTYRAVLLLGQTTDTQDTTGTVLTTDQVTCTEDQVRESILSFLGEYDQIPPMYSALKVQGKKLYELARAGVEVERAARRVTIHEIQIEKVELPEVTFTVSCSKGTYIRTLCHDVGARLGCGGCMKSLTRIRVGSFRIEDSLKLAEIEALRDSEELMEHIVPVDQMFPELLQAHVLPEFDKLIRNGNPMKSRQLKEVPNPSVHERLRIYDCQDNFYGIFRWDEKKKCYMPEKMFLQA